MHPEPCDCHTIPIPELTPAQLLCLEEQRLKRRQFDNVRAAWLLALLALCGGFWLIGIGILFRIFS